MFVLLGLGSTNSILIIILLFLLLRVGIMLFFYFVRPQSLETALSLGRNFGHLNILGTYKTADTGMGWVDFSIPEETRLKIIRVPAESDVFCCHFYGENLQHQTSFISVMGTNNHHGNTSGLTLRMFPKWFVLESKNMMWLAALHWVGIPE